MKLFVPGCLAALAIVSGFATGLSACVGDDPAPVTTSPEEDAGGGSDTGTNPPAEGGPGGDGGSCAQGTLCGTSCVDLATSAENCGACGHACGGGTCSANACTPVVVANNVTAPYGVAVAGGSAFWHRNGALERCPVTGCTGAPVLIAAEVAIGGGQPGGTTIVTDGNQVAWIATGNASGNGLDVFRCDVVGCGVGLPGKPSSGLTGAPSQIAIEGSTIFASQQTGSQRQAPISTLAFVGTGFGSDIPSGIAADATYLYWSGTTQSQAGIERCTRAATAGAPCTDRVRLFIGSQYVAAGGGVVVATSSEGIKTCAAAGCGGSATVVMASDTAASAVAASATFAAWTNPGSTSVADGTVRVCALPACTSIRTIATGQAYPVGVTIADGFVYWANRGVGAAGSIWRAAL